MPTPSAAQLSCTSFSSTRVFLLSLPTSCGQNSCSRLRGVSVHTHNAVGEPRLERRYEFGTRELMTSSERCVKVCGGGGMEMGVNFTNEGKRRRRKYNLYSAAELTWPAVRYGLARKGVYGFRMRVRRPAFYILFVIALTAYAISRLNSKSVYLYGLRLSIYIVIS